MPVTVKGLLLSILSILEILEWLASPLGWTTTSGLALYYGLLVSGMYDLPTAIALSGGLAITSGILLFEPNPQE